MQEVSRIKGFCYLQVFTIIGSCGHNDKYHHPFLEDNEDCGNDQFHVGQRTGRVIRTLSTSKTSFPLSFTTIIKMNSFFSSQNILFWCTSDSSFHYIVFLSLLCLVKNNFFLLPYTLPQPRLCMLVYGVLLKKSGLTARWPRRCTPARLVLVCRRQ